jgi:hypothetical protein
MLIGTILVGLGDTTKDDAALYVYIGDKCGADFPTWQQYVEWTIRDPTQRDDNR